MDTQSPIWTFLPGLHGTPELFGGVKQALPNTIESEFVELPTKGSQRYTTLSTWLDEHLPRGVERVLIAESFSGPIALRLAALRPDEVCGVVLVASFCDAPINPGIALLPLRPLFMVKPPKAALRHFLIGDDAEDAEVADLSNVIQTIPSRTLANRVRAVLELQEQDNPTLADVPMMILQAQSDNLVPWDAQQRLEACYPEARVHWIEAPHLAMQRYPEKCVQMIQSFVENLPVKQILVGASSKADPTE
ncbi:hypothetical protein NT6N_07050 [Oceaniferula spumae]|uniref:Serine aminopeptidase S33 domain-containing protein n=1 Tax=Oceaniferula spumae TaxID=2979115 RepID=A0AAT9FI52_9BACT